MEIRGMICISSQSFAITIVVIGMRYKFFYDRGKNFINMTSLDDGTAQIDNGDAITKIDQLIIVHFLCVTANP